MVEAEEMEEEKVAEEKGLAEWRVVSEGAGMGHRPDILEEEPLDLGEEEEEEG